MTPASLGDTPATVEPTALSTLIFGRLDAVEIRDHAGAAVP
jgi:hypothetical protein